MTELTFNSKKKHLPLTQLLINNQKFNGENQVTRPWVPVFIIFNIFPCSGITSSVQLEQWFSMCFKACTLAPLWQGKIILAPLAQIELYSNYP